MEIITAPDLSTSAEAATFLRKLTHLLKHIGVCHSEFGEVRFFFVSSAPNSCLGVAL